MTTIPSPAPPHRRLDNGGVTSPDAPASEDRRGRDRLFIDQLDEAPDPWHWHVQGHKPYRVAGLEVAPCDCHDHRQRFWAEVAAGGFVFAALIAVVLVYLFVVAS